MKTQTFDNVEQLKTVKDNKIIFEDENDNSFMMKDSKINFVGTGNILFIEKGVKLINSTISFNASNSIIYLSSNKYEYYIALTIHNNSTFFIGKDCYFNKTPGLFRCILSEQKNVVIGNNCFFSLDVWIRLADPHLIYDIETHKRINHSKSVYIGDGVWIGQHIYLLKGARIGSGSVIGAMSLVSKQIPSNVIAAGSPAKILKHNIFWTGHCVHDWQDEDTLKYEEMNTKMRKFEPKDKNEFIDFVENKLNELRNVDERLDFIKENLSNFKDKNRFAIK